MCLDIEHALKVQILNDISLDKKENGYSIVKDFMSRYPYIKQKYATSAIQLMWVNLISILHLKRILILTAQKVPVIDSNECPVWLLWKL